MKKWLDEIIAESRFKAAKQIMAKYYVGQLQGVETMEQRIMKINQRGWDSVMKKPHFETVDEVAREFQQVLHRKYQIKQTTTKYPVYREHTTKRSATN
jgi:predicted Zn-dependent peptidase